MENFAILLSIPVIFVGSIGYSILAALMLDTVKSVRPITVLISLAPIPVVIETVLLCIRGPERAATALGPVFWFVHLTAFFTGAPALANLVILMCRRCRVPFWLPAVPASVVCMAAAFVLLLTQYYVHDAVYGVDGIRLHPPPAASTLQPTNPSTPQ